MSSSKFAGFVFGALVIPALLFGGMGCGEDDSDQEPTCGTVSATSQGDRMVGIGGSCQFNGDCETNACVMDLGADFGVCSQVCDGNDACPGQMKCNGYVLNASGSYCTPSYNDSCVGAGR